MSQDRQLVPTTGAQQPSIDQMILAWLDAKAKRSHSTRKAYEEALMSYREACTQFAIDLDGDASRLALIAQGWAGQRAPASARPGEVADSTFNQRLAIISSFFTYAVKFQWIDRNPIDIVDRRRIEDYGSAEALEDEEVKSLLAAIDRRSLEGKRDYALLSLAFMTCRRVSEIASLRAGSLRVKQTTRQGLRIYVRFTHLKGNESAEDELNAGTSAALLEYLHALYGAELAQLDKDSPIWVSLSRNSSRGQPLAAKALEQIWARRTRAISRASSRFHMTRHTGAVNLEKAGATPSEIQHRLGHKSLATTGRYLDHFKKGTNRHGTKLEDMFGIMAQEDEREDEGGSS